MSIFVSIHVEGKARQQCTGMVPKKHRFMHEALTCHFVSANNCQKMYHGAPIAVMQRGRMSLALGTY